MNKNIGIMTWHHVENYGTAYQAFALKKVIESLGGTPVIIDYRRVSNSQIPRRKLLETIVKKIISVIELHKNQEVDKFEFKRGGFQKFFDRYFVYTFECKYNQDFEEINEMFDGFVCGSDQIWGPEWFNPRYFLDFVSDERKMISYAPSIGVRKIYDRDVKNEMARLLRRFPNLSIREKTGAQVVKELIGLENTVTNTLDPVFLLTANEWRSLEDSSHIPQYKYAFIFFLKNNRNNIEYAIRNAKKMGLNPVVMHSTQSGDNPHANIEEPSPEQMLAYVRNADYIYTDSFHITVLSIIFHKEFLVFNKNRASEKNEKNSRIQDLLECFGIEERIFIRGRKILSVIDYDRVQGILNRERMHSLEYLKCAINKLPISDTNVFIKQKGYSLGGCQGEISEAYSKYRKKYKEFVLLKRMDKWNFALHRECYNCKFFSPDKTAENIKMPTFYQAIESDMKEEKNPLCIYIKYYSLYDLPKIFKCRE